MPRFAVVVIDIIAMGVFALLARIAHQSESMPLSVAGWLDTWWPFALGVAVAWILLSLPKVDGMKVAPAGVTVWIVAVIVGLGVWSLRHSAMPHWSFIVVASVMSGLLLLGWRLLARFVSRPKTVNTATPSA